MRPLTEEEKTHVRETLHRTQRRLFFVFLRRAVLMGILLLFFLAVDFSWRFLGWLSLAWLILSNPFSHWLLFSAIRRQFEKDLQAGVLEQRSGSVYDSIRWEWPFGPRSYWVSTGDKGLELDEREFKGIQVGDTVVVEYLPDTQLIVTARRVTQP